MIDFFENNAENMSSIVKSTMDDPCPLDNLHRFNHDVDLTAFGE